MAADRRLRAAGPSRRAQARGERARGSQRDLLCVVDGLPMERAAEGFAAQEHGARLFHPARSLGGSGAHARSALCRGARGGGPRGEPDGGDHRQSDRQSRSKRGSGLDPQGYDAGKKVTGRKRHILVDTLGLLLSVAVHSAAIQDRDGAAFVLDKRPRSLFPFIERIFADGGYQGPRAAKAAAATGRWIIEVVKRNELHKFVVL